MTGLLKALGEFFKGPEKKETNCNLDDMDKFWKEMKISTIHSRIRALRGWKKNANPLQLKWYYLLAPVYFPDRDSLADYDLLSRFITAIRNKCKEDRERRKMPKPRWIQG